MDIKIFTCGLRRVFSFFGVYVWCWFMLFCAAGVASAEVVDRIVAVVNDDIIRLRELDRAAFPLENQIREKGFPLPKEGEEIYKIRTEVLNNLIDEKLADQEIRNSGIFVEDNEVDSAIEQIKAMNYYSDEDLRMALTANDVNMADYREELKRQILRNKLVNIKIKSKIIVTPSDIAAFYEKNADKYAPKRKYMLRNIMIAPPEPMASGSSSDSVYKTMADVRRQLSDGAAFEDLARKYSQGVNAADGGRLGLFSIDELAENIGTAIKDLQPGEFSEVTETEQGLQIFYVEKIEEIGGQALNEVSDEIRQSLYEETVNEKFQSWINHLREDAHIKIIR
jgi:peptidyl-prolyl cis-trans isomerase SurA